jgi:REP element-mobilizing transposase RayT
MPQGKNRPVRRPTRAPEYDYAQPGAYFVTVVTQDRRCLFGEVVNRVMILNPAGKMIEKWWHELPNKFSSVEIDENNVMPNHFHGILWIRESTVVPPGVEIDNISNPVVGTDLRVGPGHRDVPTRGAHTGAPLPTIVDDDLSHLAVGADLRVGSGPVCAPLPTILQWFKTMTTNEYIRGVKEFNWPRFDGKLWQRSYYDHVIHNDVNLLRIRQYIRDNPSSWEKDEEYPQ